MTRISAAEYRAIMRKESGKKTKNKYGSKKLKTPEGTFDSIGEYNRWLFLKDCEKRGLIQNLERQIPFELIGADGTQLESISKKGSARKLYYFCDHRFILTKNKEIIIEDYKGFDTRVSKMKRMLVEKSHKIKIKLVTKETLSNL